MHASTLTLASFLPLAFASFAACAAPAAEAPATATVTAVAEAARPSTRVALEAVLGLVAAPEAERAGWELSRVEARSDDGRVRVFLDVEVRGADEVDTAARFRMLIDELIRLDGALECSVRSSHDKDPTWLQVSGICVAFESGAPRPVAEGAERPDVMTALRGLASEPEVRLGGVDIERRGNDDDEVRVQAHRPGTGERLERLQGFAAGIEERIPGACVVRVVLQAAWDAGAVPAPEPRLFHWEIEVARGA